LRFRQQNQLLPCSAYACVVAAAKPVCLCTPGGHPAPPSSLRSCRYQRKAKRDSMSSQPPPYPGHNEKSPQGYPGQFPQQQFVPPQQQYMPQQPGAPVVVQHQYVAPRMFGASPINMQCPNCHAQVTTATIEDIGVIAWIAAGVMCAVGLWCCMCIPLCMDSLKVTPNSDQKSTIHMLALVLKLLFFHVCITFQTFHSFCTCVKWCFLLYDLGATYCISHNL